MVIPGAFSLQSLHRCSRLSARRHAGNLATLAAEDPPPPTSYMPVVSKEAFDSVMKRMSAAKPQVQEDSANYSASATTWATDLPAASHASIVTRTDTRTPLLIWSGTFGRSSSGIESIPRVCAA